jgi:ribose/xylose/arabinose/galactoside ABC-type transport system permease subunit
MGTRRRDHVKLKMRKGKEAGIFAVFIAISLVIAISSPVFLRIDNLFDLIKSNIVLGIMAIAMLPIILTGGIDVSVASIIAAVTVVIGNFMIGVSSNIFLVFVVGCASGVALGLINGLLIAKLKIPPIVATLGTMSIIIGVVLYLTNGTWITGIPKNFIEYGRTDIFVLAAREGEPIGLPIQFAFFVGAAVLMWFVLRYTLVGRGVYAMGGSVVSAERIGYDLDKITIFIYALEGFLVGLAGTVHTSIMRQVDPGAFNGFELQVIAAVVLGGASVLGGYGSVFGTIMGVALFSVLNNGLILMHIPVFWQKIVVGTVLIASISVDILQKRYSENRMTRVDIEQIEG